MKTELKNIEFAGKNFRIEGLELANEEVYFTIIIGSKEMYMSGTVNFNIHWNHIQDTYDMENCDVMLEDFQWEHNMKTGFLNKRNTALICEAIEKIAMENPEGCGFDWENAVESHDSRFQA